MKIKVDFFLIIPRVWLIELTERLEVQVSVQAIMIKGCEMNYCPK